MNFDLTKEQEMIRKLIRDFAEVEVAPGADSRDPYRGIPFGRFFEDGVRDYGSSFPEQYGGAEADTIGLLSLLKSLAAFAHQQGYIFCPYFIGRGTSSFAWYR